MRHALLLTTFAACLPTFAAAQGHEDLRAEIRKIVREEIRAALKEMCPPPKAAEVVADGKAIKLFRAQQVEPVAGTQGMKPMVLQLGEHGDLRVEVAKLVDSVKGQLKGQVLQLDDVTKGKGPHRMIVVGGDKAPHLFKLGGKDLPGECQVECQVEFVGPDGKRIVKKHAEALKAAAECCEAAQELSRCCEQAKKACAKTEDCRGKGCGKNCEKECEKAEKGCGKSCEQECEKAEKACGKSCEQECEKAEKGCGKSCEQECEKAEKGCGKSCEQSCEQPKPSEPCGESCQEKCGECTVEIAPLKKAEARKVKLEGKKKSKKAKKARAPESCEQIELKIG